MSYRFLFFIFISNCFLSNYVNSLIVKRDTSSTFQFTLEEQRHIVQRHNDLRGALALGLFGLPEASNMQAMIYDPVLESYAQNHTNKCLFELSNVEEYGENVFKTNSSVTPFTTMLIALNVWWSQIKKVNSNVFDPNDNALNFAQIAWASTYKVGCSANDCETFKLAVCYYYPRGNIDNTDIYKSGLHCKKNNDCINVNNGTCEIGKGLCAMKNEIQAMNITCNTSNPVGGTLLSQIDNITSGEKPPENSVSLENLENLTGNLVNTVQNGLNGAGSFIKNTSSNLVNQIGSTANGFLGNATNLLNNVGQSVGNAANTLIDHTHALLNTTGINLDGSVIGNIPGIVNGAISSLLNGTQNTNIVISNNTDTLKNTTNDILNNLPTVLNEMLNQTVNTTNVVENSNNMVTKSNLSTPCPLSNQNLIPSILSNISNELATVMTVLNGTVGNSSGVSTPIISVTVSLLSTTMTPESIMNSTESNGLPLMNTTIVGDLLNTTSSSLVSPTTSIFENVTSTSGISSISSTLNLISSTEASSTNSSMGNGTTTMLPIETTTCEWGIMCNSNANITNQILENITTKAPNNATTISTPGNSTCRDTQDTCDIMVLFCSFTAYQPFMFPACPKTCKQC